MIDIDDDNDTDNDDHTDRKQRRENEKGYLIPEYELYPLLANSFISKRISEKKKKRKNQNIQKKK